MTKRHPLLIYRKSMAPYPGKFLILAALLLGLWSLERLGWTRPLTAFAETWLAAAGGLTLVGWAFTRLAPRLAYVEARPDHLRLRVPLYRLDISYRRILSSRPVEFSRLFPPEEAPRSRRRLLKAFQGSTALALDLRGWPLPPWLLHIFLGPYALTPGQPGLVLLVEDWMRLGNQIADRMEVFRASLASSPSRPAAEILSQDEA